MPTNICIDSITESYSALKDYRAWSFTGWSRLRSRFLKTKLGTLWVLLANILSISILALVYTQIFPSEDPVYFIAYIGTGYAIWTSMTSSMLSSLSLVEYHSDRIANTRRSHFFYVYEEIYYQLLNFAIGCLPILVFMFLLQMADDISALEIMILPRVILGFSCYIMFMYVTCIGCSLMGAYLPDISQVVPAILQLSFLTSPVMFSSSVLGRYALLSVINPLYLILKVVRDPLLWSGVNETSLATLIVCAVALMAASTVMTIIYNSFRYKLTSIA